MSSLSSDAKLEYSLELANAVPWPVIDTPEERQRRVFTAIGAFDDLCPGNAYEGRLAVQIVLCGAHSAETLREAGIFRNDFAKVKCCRAQAASLAREGRAAKRMLAQEQKVRLATEAVAQGAPARPASMAEPPAQAASVLEPPAHPALVSTQPPSAVTQTAPLPAPATPWPPIPAAALARPPTAVPPVAAPPRLAATQVPPPPVPGGPAPPPSREAIAKAEAFALKHPMTAARIRCDRGVRPRNSGPFRDVAWPADPAVIDALVRGSSEFLALLDDVGGEELPKVA